MYTDGTVNSLHWQWRGVALVYDCPPGVGYQWAQPAAALVCCRPWNIAGLITQIQRMKHTVDSPATNYVRFCTFWRAHWTCIKQRYRLKKQGTCQKQFLDKMRLENTKLYLLYFHLFISLSLFWWIKMFTLRMIRACWNSEAGVGLYYAYLLSQHQTTSFCITDKSSYNLLLKRALYYERKYYEPTSK